jgi:hypothetical protein
MWTGNMHIHAGLTQARYNSTKNIHWFAMMNWIHIQGLLPDNKEAIRSQ